MRGKIVIVALAIVVLPLTSIALDARNFNQLFTTSRVEGDTVVIHCQYFEDFTFTDVYSVQQVDGMIKVMTKSHGLKEFVASSVMSIDYHAYDQPHTPPPRAQ